MNYLSSDEYLLIAKILAHVLSNTAITLTEADKEAAKQLIKKMADQRYDWSCEKREQLKLLVDAVVD